MKPQGYFHEDIPATGATEMNEPIQLISTNLPLSDELDETQAQPSEEIDVNTRWRMCFQLWWDQYGERSIRTWQACNIASQVGFPFPYITETMTVESDGHLGNIARFGQILNSKHRHVHAGYRLISDRKQNDWGKKTKGSTYHLELKDKPRDKNRVITSDFTGSSEE